MRMQRINLLNGWKSFPHGRTRTETNKNKSSYSKFLDALHSVTNCPRFSAGIFSVSVDNQQPISGKKRRTCLQCRRFLLYKKGVIFIRNISLTFWRADGIKDRGELFTGRNFLNWKFRTIQFWQQILPIWNAQHRQNPVAGHTCVSSNIMGFLITECRNFIPNKRNNIWAGVAGILGQNF